MSKATSVTSLIKNADRRAAALRESDAGLTQLRSRGLSEAAISAIGLTGKAEEARSIRKLLKATPAELRALSASVGGLSDSAAVTAYKLQGDVIGRQVRDVLATWLSTETVKPSNISETTITNLIIGSKGPTEGDAQDIASTIGAVVKR